MAVLTRLLGLVPRSDLERGINLERADFKIEREGYQDAIAEINRKLVDEQAAALDLKSQLSLAMANARDLQQQLDAERAFSDRTRAALADAQKALDSARQRIIAVKEFAETLQVA